MRMKIMLYMLQIVLSAKEYLSCLNCRLQVLSSAQCIHHPAYIDQVGSSIVQALHRGEDWLD